VWLRLTEWKFSQCLPRKIFKQDHPQAFKVMTNGKNIQNAPTAERTNHLERVQDLGERQGQAEEMQEMWKEIHHQREGNKMIGDNFWLDDMIASETRD